MGRLKSFTDGIISLTNDLINQRDVTQTNRVWHKHLDDEELRSISKTGLMNKITRLKAGMALGDTLHFDAEDDRNRYETLAPQVKKAVKGMLNFGRSLVVIHEKGADLSLPLPGDITEREYKLDVFTGDMVTVTNVERNLSSRLYLKPKKYMVRGFPIHPSRVVDFTYIEPPEWEAEIYRYGGIPEPEMIYNQLINDAVVERATPGILEKSSTLFYKVTGFKGLLRDRQEGDVIRYFRSVESQRHALGATLMDKEDELENIQQALTNLADTDNITLRRLAMVTGIPLSWLVGEAVKGLNASGEIENDVMRATIDNLLNDYILPPLNNLLVTLGTGQASVKENRGEDPKTRAEMETQWVNNAMVLAQLGEDYEKYLRDREVIEEDPFEKAFADESWEPPEDG